MSAAFAIDYARLLPLLSPRRFSASLPLLAELILPLALPLRHITP
jgi:hypothetical protein